MLETAWLLKGNKGIDGLASFLGTKDEQPLVIKTDDEERMRFFGDRRVRIGMPKSNSELDLHGCLTFKTSRARTQSASMPPIPHSPRAGHREKATCSSTTKTILPRFGGLRCLPRGAELQAAVAQDRRPGAAPHHRVGKPRHRYLRPTGEVGRHRAGRDHKAGPWLQPRFATIRPSGARL